MTVLLFAIYLVLVIALPLVLSAVIGFRSLPTGPAGPNCAQDTLPLVSIPLRLARHVVGNLSLQRRWCPSCEWAGYARPTTLTTIAFSHDPAHQTEQVRTLELGGRPWRVLLESWRERGRCYGRLRFIAPSGRQWCDPLAAFNGPSRNEVRAQALALSDRLLAYRLREVISG